MLRLISNGTINVITVLSGLIIFYISTPSNLLEKEKKNIRIKKID